MNSIANYLKALLPRQKPPPVESAWSLSRWMAVAFCCVFLALATVVGVTVWGIRHNLQVVESTLIDSESGRIRSHSLRTNLFILQEIFREPAFNGTLDHLRAHPRLKAHWQFSLKDESRLYVAIVDIGGTVIAHTNADLIGKSLGPAWYDRRIDEAGDDVVETRNQALTGGRRAIDVTTPMIVDGKEIGQYHSGLSYEWLEKEMAVRKAQARNIWTLILLLTVVCVLASTVALFQIARRVTVLGQAVKMTRLRRFAEVGQLMAGIAHEIRNPLNAMRLNLHVLGRTWEQQLSGRFEDDEPDTQPGEIIRETNREIERVEGLMRILLGYARPDQPNNDFLDIRNEIQSTLGFLRPVLEKAEVVVRLVAPSNPVVLHMDRDRLRQVILNLVSNAKDATGAGGTIQIQVTNDGGAVRISVKDDGPGVPKADAERIFEPFYSTKELGTGLGLALVRRFVEEAGGNIVCERNEPNGARFVMVFPTGTGSLAKEPAPML